jgi:hypothetical protein
MALNKKRFSSIGLIKADRVERHPDVFGPVIRVF